MIRQLVLSVMLLLCAAQAHAEIAEPGSLVHDDVERVHYLYVPPSAGPETPLVVALHGMGGNAANLRFGIGLTEVAAQAGYAVVYPQGVRLPQGSRHWNAGFDMMEVDDLGYLTALVRDITRTHGLSTEGTVMFGISMGGYMAYHMGCHSDLPLAGIIVVAGSMHPSDIAACPGAGSTSLLHIHGVLDPLIPFAGGGHWSDPGAKAVGVPQLVARWAKAAAATQAPALTSHPKVRALRRMNDAAGTEVQLLALPAFGHDWPSETTAGYVALDDIARFLKRRRHVPVGPVSH